MTPLHVIVTGVHTVGFELLTVTPLQLGNIQGFDPGLTPASISSLSRSKLIQFVRPFDHASESFSLPHH